MATKSNTQSATSSSGTVSFKAYLLGEGNEKPKEVRRFGMEQTEVTSFDLLKKKLRHVFPSISAQDFSISWKDFEGDDIIISSNEELLTALTESTDQIHRLYIEPKGSRGGWSPIGCFVDVGCPIDAAAEANNLNEDEIVFTSPGCKRAWQSSGRSLFSGHPSVFCDGCNKPVLNHRYKCLECDDYDLCHDCESLMMHKEHIMLRIPVAMSHYVKLNHFSKSMRYMSDTLHKIDNRTKKQERRLQKFIATTACDDFLGDAEEVLDSKRCRRDEKEKEKDKERERKDKRRDNRDSKQQASFSCNARAGTSAHASARAAAHSSSRAEASSSNDSPPTRASRGGCPFPSGIIGNLLNPQSLATLQQLIQHLSPVPEQLLQEVSQSLADVRLADTASTSAPSSPSGNPFSGNSKATTAQDSKKAASTSPSAATAEVTQDKPEAATSAQSATQAAADVPDTPCHHSGRSSRSSSSGGDVEEWTVVDDQARDGNAEQSTAYPKLPTVEPTPAPQSSTLTEPEYQGDPKVKLCLQALKDMGYNIQEQMIIDLAEEYQGNLSRVLNVLLS